MCRFLAESAAKRGIGLGGRPLQAFEVLDLFNMLDRWQHLF